MAWSLRKIPHSITNGDQPRDPSLLSHFISLYSILQISKRLRRQVLDVSSPDDTRGLPRIPSLWNKNRGGKSGAIAPCFSSEAKPTGVSDRGVPRVASHVANEASMHAFCHTPMTGWTREQTWSPLRVSTYSGKQIRHTGDENYFSGGRNGHRTPVGLAFHEITELIWNIATHTCARARTPQKRKLGRGTASFFPFLSLFYIYFFNSLGRCFIEFTRNH